MRWPTDVGRVGARAPAVTAPAAHARFVRRHGPRHGGTPLRIQHTITFVTYGLPEAKVAALKAELARLGLVKPTDPLLNFRLCEDDPAWPDVDPLLQRYRTIDLCWTEFTSAELLAASWLDVRPEWHHGYPMPDADGSYLRATYDLAEYCPACGAGAAQIAPFRMRAEPKWGRRAILQLNWVFDEYFVHSKLYKSVFAPLGVEALPVLHHRTGTPLQTVVQLKAAGDGVDLILLDAAGSACDACGRFKYLPLGRVRPALREAPADGHLWRSRQVFGSSTSSHRLVLMSAVLYERFAASGARGVSFGVVDLARAA